MEGGSNGIICILLHLFFMRKIEQISTEMLAISTIAVILQITAFQNIFLCRTQLSNAFCHQVGEQFPSESSATIAAKIIISIWNIFRILSSLKNAAYKQSNHECKQTKRPITWEKGNLQQVTCRWCITVPKALINKWGMPNSTRGHENLISHNRTEHLKVKKRQSQIKQIQSAHSHCN